MIDFVVFKTKLLQSEFHVIFFSCQCHLKPEYLSFKCYLFVNVQKIIQWTHAMFKCWVCHKRMMLLSYCSRLRAHGPELRFFQGPCGFTLGSSFPFTSQKYASKLIGYTKLPLVVKESFKAEVYHSRSTACCSDCSLISDPHNQLRNIPYIVFLSWIVI